MPFLAQMVDDVVVNKIDLEKPSLTLGRHPDCDVQIDDAAISSRHAELSIAKSEYLEDLVEVKLSSKKLDRAVHAGARTRADLANPV